MTRGYLNTTSITTRGYLNTFGPSSFNRYKRNLGANDVHIYNRNSKSSEFNRKIMDRLIEGEKITLAHPGIQKYLISNFDKEEDYFYSPDAVKKTNFIKAKAHVYAQLNFFDSLLCIPSKKEESWFIRKLE